jgi:NTE family protein
MSTRSFSLVLGGGGLKGLAHIGALQALEEAGLRPSGVVGSSIGSLIAAAWAAGRSVDYMRERALRLRRKDVFQVAHTDMAFKRMQSPAVYRHEPLDHLIRELVGDKTFDELKHPLIVNTVDINSGMQVLWECRGSTTSRGRRRLRLLRPAGDLPAPRNRRPLLRGRRGGR